MPFPSAQKAGRAEAEPDLSFQSPLLIKADRQKCTDIIVVTFRSHCKIRSLCYTIMLKTLSLSLQKAFKFLISCSTTTSEKDEQDGGNLSGCLLFAFLIIWRKGYQGRPSKRKFVYKTHLKCKLPKESKSHDRQPKSHFQKCWIHTFCYSTGNYTHSLLMEKQTSEMTSPQTFTYWAADMTKALCRDLQCTV